MTNYFILFFWTDEKYIYILIWKFLHWLIKKFNNNNNYGFFCRLEIMFFNFAKNFFKNFLFGWIFSKKNEFFLEKSYLQFIYDYICQHMTIYMLIHDYVEELTIYGHTWLHILIYGKWQYMIAYGNIWPFIVIYGKWQSWPHIIIYGHTWILKIYDSI